MTEGFDGFQGMQGRHVTVPDVFFTQLAPQIRSLPELKVTLHLMWVLSQRVGRPRCIEYGELANDALLLQSVKAEDGPRPAEDYLREGLELAVTRGTALQVQLQRGSRRQTWYFLNTPASREAVEQLRAGTFAGAEEVFGGEPISEIRIYRPNVFALYEQNIGPLTPMMAEKLRAAEQQYPWEWIEEAIKAGVEYNRRNWRYVETILERWSAEGKTAGASRKPAEDEGDPYGYFRSKYQHLYR